jgi:SAM-dependent methyltransferase
VSQYRERALAGETATLAEWNEYLIAFHQKHGRFGEKVVEQMHTSSGETSYDLLASRIQAMAPDARAILDIGCGDGTLMARIAERFGHEVSLTGIELVEMDVARARERLPTAALLCGDASDLAVGQKSQDVVTSHLAFMAMPSIDRVLARAHNALRPFGVLAFVAEDPLGGGTVFGLVGSAVAIVRKRFPNFSAKTPRPMAIEREDVLQALLARIGFTRVAIEPFRISAKLSAEQLWAFVEGSYPFGVLDGAARNDLREELRTQISAIERDPDGAVFALRFVTAYA